MFDWSSIEGLARMLGLIISAMSKINYLLSILNHSFSWNDIYNKLISYNSSQNNLAGKIFEEFCKYYYLIEPTVKHEYKHVWLFPEVPHGVKEKLNLGKIDYGIDLILEGHDGSFSAVQCKFRNNQNSNISWTKDNLANLFAEGDKADYFIVFTNASGLDKHSLTKKENKLKIVTLGDLFNISSSVINEIKNYITGLTKPPVSPKQPWEYQHRAIQKVINGFKQHDRGQLILPCGSGKTLVSLWIKEALNINHTLVLVPSLALLRQIKNEWAINSKRFIPYICVCSETDIDKKKDYAVVHAYEISGKVSTSPDEIREFLSKHQETIVYSTYQSLEAICNATKESEFKFDLAICDEAHKTAGSRLSKFGLIHSDSNIKVRKRLYMTATPRILSNNLRNELNDEVINYLYDMGNQDVYGTEFYRMSFKEAIDKKILVDYQIVAIGVSDLEINTAIKKRKYISDNKTTIDEIANNYALEQFMQKYKPTHAITFHSSVKKAKSFQERHQEIYPEVATYHVNGELTTNERSIRMKEFERSSKSVMSNARCLTEGVNVPAIDIVYFCDPKNSKIDIIQATGRALRKPKNKEKKFGYVVVPIFHSEKENVEEIIESGPFKNLMSVIRAICSHDERLVDEIKKIKIGLGERQPTTKHLSIDYSCDLITMDGFHEKLKESLFDQIINKMRIPWRDFESAREYARGLNLNNYLQWREHCKNNSNPNDIPSDPYIVYKNQGWLSWSNWLGTKNKGPKDYNFSSFEIAKKFAHELNLKSECEWRAYSKNGSKPEKIPSNPNVIYKTKGWISWPDWLGTKNKGRNDWIYLPFIEARKFVHTLKLKSETEWRLYCKSGKKPKDIASVPRKTYQDKGWVSTADWLGTEKISNMRKKLNWNRNFLSFEEAKNFSQNSGIKNETEWRTYSKSGDKPDNIPSNPYSTYRNKGWISWGDWLGTGSRRNQGRQYRPFIEARAFVHCLKLKNAKQWKEFCKSSDRPANIPAKPYVIYKNKGWLSLADWLGTKNKKGSDWIFLPMEEAKTFIHSLNLKSKTQWGLYCKSGAKPENIPFAPHLTYKNKGWISWPDWLGTKILSID